MGWSRTRRARMSAKKTNNIARGALCGLVVLAGAAARAQSAPPSDSSTPAPSAAPAASASADAAPSFSPQIYGILDSGVRHIDRASKAGDETQFASGLNTSRFGFRGTEAIDADWRGTLRLEGGFNSGTGAQSNSALFDRTASVGLGWRSWDLNAGRLESFGYELAATGVTDPLAMALNLPNYASPAAAGSKTAPVLGANPLQGVYTYTYGQLRYNNAIKVTTGGQSWSGGVFYSVGGVSNDFSANSALGARLGGTLGPVQLQGLFEQSQDESSNRSSLGVLAGTLTLDAWKFQAGIHDLRIDAGYNSSGLGNGASSSGIQGSSTTVSTVLASATENFRLTVADLGVTWSVRPNVPLALVAYKTHTEGAGEGNSTALVGLGKWKLSKHTTLFLEADWANESGRLAKNTVNTTTTSLAYMTGINLRF